MDVFYNKKYGDAARRLKLLQDRLGKPTDFTDDLDKDEVEDLMGVFLELRGELRKLQWYGEVNRRGFIKITKKLDKKIPNNTTQRLYLESKVDPKPFATNVHLLETMNVVNDWLSILGSAKFHDDNSSTHSSQSIRRTSSKVTFDFPGSLLDAIDQAIRSDDAQGLENLLRDPAIAQYEAKDPSHQKHLLSLLQRSISCRSQACITRTLAFIVSLEEEEEINLRNCIHRLVISIGRSKPMDDSEALPDTSPSKPNNHTNYIRPAAPPNLAPPRFANKEHETASMGKLGKDDKSVTILQYLLDSLCPEQRSALQTRDIHGRMPLHYAAQYGLVVVCQMIIARMQSWGQFTVSEGIDTPFWQDTSGMSPLHLSVTGGHPITTQTLLEAEDWRGSSERKSAICKHRSKSGEVLALATKANFIIIVQLLVEAGVDLDYQDAQGETALHLAARFGLFGCAKALLKGSNSQKAKTDIAEYSFGWTPLFVACVDGHLDIAELLIDSGCDLQLTDVSGWSAKEHAALRGHMAIARKLANATPPPYLPTLEVPTKVSLSHSIIERKSNGSGSGNAIIRTTEPVKTFGHRYLTKESMILVSLGTMDMRKAIEAVNLDRVSLTDAHSTQLDTALSVIVSASEANGEPSIIDLPVQENVSTDPIVFTALDTTKVKLLFDIVPTYAGSNDRIVGRGVALLSRIKPSIGSKRITLQGDVAVPILAAHSLEVIGSVNFNFLIITPFKHHNMSITENQTYWKSMTSTMVIGHRGDFSFTFTPTSFFLTFVKAWVRMWLLGRLCSLERILFRYEELSSSLRVILIVRSHS